LGATGLAAGVGAVALTTDLGEGPVKVPADVEDHRPVEKPVEQGCGDGRVVKGMDLGQPWDGTKAARAAEFGRTGGSSGFPRLHLKEDDGRAVGVVGRRC